MCGCQALLGPMLAEAISKGIVTQEQARALFGAESRISFNAGAISENFNTRRDSEHVASDTVAE